MPSTIDNILTFLRQTSSGLVKRQDPLVNERILMPITYPFGTNQEIDPKFLWDEVKKSIELTTCLRVINEDVMSDGYRLIPLKTTRGSGKINVKTAREFLNQNRFDEELSEFLYDLLATGDAYIYKRRLTEQSVRQFVTKSVNNLDFNFKSRAIERLILEVKSLDEDIYRVKSFQTIASSTIQIVHDKHGNALHYVQNVHGNFAKFFPQEIIHLRFMPLDGKMYGFTPIRAMLKELEILTNIKNLSKNSTVTGQVQRIILAKNMNPTSTVFKRLAKQFRNFETIQDRHKTMLVAGGPGGELIQLDEPSLKDLEFDKLLHKVTIRVINAWGIPSSRLPGLLLEKAGNQATNEEGYWRQIEHTQNIIENIINTQLLNEFNVELKFNRTYRVNEAREADTLMKKGDAISKLNTELGKYDLRITQKKIIDLVNFKDEDIEAHKFEPIQMMIPEVGTNRDKNMRDSQLKNPNTKVEADNQRSQTQQSNT